MNQKPIQTARFLLYFERVSITKFSISSRIFFFYVRKFARRMVMDGYILSYTFCACFLPGEDSAIKNNNGAARFKGIETKPGKGRGQNEKAARREAV